MLELNQYVELEKLYEANVYAKRPLVIVEGKGATVKDIDGKEYIDCIGGHGVCIVGHSHPKVVEAIANQARRIISCPGILHNDVRAKLLKKLVEITPKELNKVFLSNSGTEAVECAIKLARKHTGKKEIIAMKKGFHGRTMGSLSATWKKKYRIPFEPLIPYFKFSNYNDLESLRKAISKDTAAVIVEPVQGEGGVNIPSNGFLRGVRETCDEKNVLLIMDEVQTGFGRTGELFAFQHWDVTPDILCLAKGIAGGVPMGATLAKKEIMDSLKQGEHASTFGGNPLACAAASAAIDVIINEKLPQKSKADGEYFLARLKDSLEESKIVREIRGIGLMLAVELKVRCSKYVYESLERGVLFLTSGTHIIRMLPPLIITRQQIDKVVNVLAGVLK